LRVPGGGTIKQNQNELRAIIKRQSQDKINHPLVFLYLIFWKSCVLFKNCSAIIGFGELSLFFFNQSKSASLSSKFDFGSDFSAPKRCNYTFKKYQWSLKTHKKFFQ